MTEVSHPHAERDASPAAVTVGTTTYSVDDDGVIDCPDDEAAAVADALADVYDVAADDLLAEPNSEERSPMSLEDMTYDELYEAASDADVEGRSGMTKDELIDELREGE